MKALCLFCGRELGELEDSAVVISEDGECFSTDISLVCGNCYDERVTEDSKWGDELEEPDVSISEEWIEEE